MVVEISMSRPFNAHELEVLRILALEHKSLQQLVFDVLDSRHSLPDWMHEAQKAGWALPRDWYKEERDQIAKTGHDLIDWHVIGLDGRWACYRIDPNPMQIIAEQAS